MTIDDGEDIEAEPEARDDGAGDPPPLSKRCGTRSRDKARRSPPR